MKSRILSNLARYIRGLVGTALTWGVVWSAVNTLALFAKWLPNPPEYTTRSRMALSILTNQSVSALIWGTVLGAIFSVALTRVAARWPSAAPLGQRRLTWIGGVVGLGLGASMVRLGSWFELGAIAVISLASAGVGALLGAIAERAQRKMLAESIVPRLPSV